MEGVPVTLFMLSCHINKVLEKLQDISSADSLNDYLNSTNELKTFLITNTLPEKKDIVKVIFNNYDKDVVRLSKSDYKGYSECGRALISSILKFLGKKGSGVLIIETYIRLCLKVIGNYNKFNVKSENIQNFKVLLDGVLLCIKVVKKNWDLVFKQSTKSSFILCFNQIGKCLTFLLTTIENGNSYLRQYVITRMEQCFERMLKDLHETTDDNSIFGCEFINLMDSCLGYVSQLSQEINNSNVDVLSNLKVVVDELLCHAMSIAHVTTSDLDHRAISAHSQKVLTEIENLKEDISKGNTAMIQLNCDVVSDALCSLEQRVNYTVLLLVLQISTELNSPLKELLMKCKTTSANQARHAQDLDPLISKFDMELDRIMQIGAFSVSCTSDVKSIMEIKSCLASLESLETELIPSISAVYLDASETNMDTFHCLVERWIKEIADLKSVIDKIIDPTAFAEVVEQQICGLIEFLKTQTDLTTDEVKSAIEKIVKYGKKLVKTLIKNVDDTQIPGLLVQLRMSLQECEAGLSLLNSEVDVNKVLPRLLKRCSLVVSSLKDMIAHLQDCDLGNDWPQTPAAVKNYYKLCPGSCDSTKDSPDMALLTPFKQAAITMVKERGVLYSTPNKVGSARRIDRKYILNISFNRTPVVNNRSKCMKLLPRKLEMENTLDFEITTILENLTQLSSTFNQSVNVVDEPAKDEKQVETPDMEGSSMRTTLLRSLDNLSLSSTLAASKDSRDQYNTPQRVEDLRAVEKRINQLRSAKIGQIESDMKSQ